MNDSKHPRTDAFYAAFREEHYRGLNLDEQEQQSHAAQLETELAEAKEESASAERTWKLSTVIKEAKEECVILTCENDKLRLELAAMTAERDDSRLDLSMYQAVCMERDALLADKTRLDRLEELFSTTANESRVWQGFLSVVTEKGFRAAIDAAKA